MSARPLPPRLAAYVLAAGALAGCAAAPRAIVTKTPEPARPPPSGSVCAEIATLSTAPEPLDPTTAPVVRVEVRGAKKAAELCAAIQSKPGVQVNDRTVAADIHRIWDTGRIEDVVVARELAPGGVVLAYEVTTLGRFTGARIDGIGSAGIGSEADFLPSPAQLDVVTIHEVERKLERALADQGYRHATTKTRTEARDEDGPELVFEVDLGPRSVVRSITFPGIAATRAGEITRLFVTHEGAPLVAEALDRDVIVATAYYYDHGMINARVHPPVVSETGEGLDLAITIDEGPVYKIGAVHFAGDLLDRESDYKKRFWTTPEHGIFNRSVIAADIDRIREYHRSQGFVADVEPESDVKTDKLVIDMTLRVKKR